MKSLSHALVIGLLLTFSSALLAQDESRPKTIADSVSFIWRDIERDFVALAEAMPEEKWNYKPTQGEFKGVRTFGEQVKHVACANPAWAKQMAGQKPPERCDIGGPNPAKTKAEILGYLRDSFTSIDKVIADTSADNLLHANAGPYWGPNRLSVP